MRKAGFRRLSAAAPSGAPMHPSFIPPAVLAPPIALIGRDALAFLATTHDELRQALDELDPALSVDSLSRARLVELCLALKIHGMLERELVHPAARAALAHDALIDRAEADHEEVQQLIESLLALDPAEQRAHECLHALHRMVERQFEEAEVALFTRLAISDLDLEGLGLRLTGRQREIRAELGLSTGDV
jgi:hypothetical protein